MGRYGVQFLENSMGRLNDPFFPQFSPSTEHREHLWQRKCPDTTHPRRSNLIGAHFINNMLAGSDKSNTHRPVHELITAT